MPERSQQILDLQALDVEIGRLTRQVQQTATRLADDTKTRAAEYATRQAEQALQARQREQRSAEMDLAAVEERIKGAEQKLYSGKGSPRELQALQREIEGDRARRGQLEEAALTAMDATAAAQAELQRITGAVQRVLGDLAGEHERLNAERQQTQAELERRQAARQRLAARIDAASLGLYERLRQRFPDGIAAAELVQGRCEGCHTTLPSAEVQRARRTEELSQCSVCGRIIHVPMG